jgi:hypothetical protein
MTSDHAADSGPTRAGRAHLGAALALAAIALSGTPTTVRADAIGPWTSLHAGISDAPETPNTDFALLRHTRPRSGLPLGLDFLALNLGSIGRHRTAPAGSDQRVHFASMQLGYAFGRVTVASGLAAVSHVTDYLSSGYQFHSHLGVRFGRWELGLGHLSNARTREPNKGESYLSLGFSF